MNMRAALVLLFLVVPALRGLAEEQAGGVYRVRPGDTLLRLSWQYSVSPDAIRDLNHLKSDHLQAGQDILLPISSMRAQPAATAAPVTIPAPVAIRAEPVQAEALPTSPVLPVRRAVALPQAVPALIPPPASDVGERLLSAARDLAAQNIRYDEPWTPPGLRSPWRMDCSNTARYLYEVAAGIDLGRTASEQYDSLRQKRRAWSVPMDGQRLVRIDRLQSLLKAGDLLFWENTYRPERRSPITHVMIFLGEDENGRWIMAGSRGSRAGGPNIYPFDPRQPAGGYSFFFGLIHHTGRFVAYGRPVS